jgi:hypothetical protein
MTTPKNPAAVEIGRRGGVVKNPRKGFGSMSPERRAEAMAKSLATRRANISQNKKPSRKGPPLRYPRCPCGLMTAARALQRNHKCQPAA